MARIALTLGAAAALAISAPAAATITVVNYTASGPGNGTFTLDYDSTFQDFFLVGMKFTLGSTTFTPSTADIGVGGQLLGGDPYGFAGINPALNVDDFYFFFNPRLPSQAVDITYMVSGGPITVGTETITSQVIRGPGFVPEPATWAMMLVGFAAMGLALRRRRRVSTAR